MAKFESIIHSDLSELDIYSKTNYPKVFFRVLEGQNPDSPQRRESLNSTEALSNLWG